jgi:hypothetical protein
MPVFWVMIVCDLVAAFMALLWLKPVAARTVAQADAAMAATATSAQPDQAAA